jgi:GDP-L-fucose synthase
MTNNRYLLEPLGRNIAPAIALACFGLPEEEIVLVTPSDHLIKDEVAYKKVLEKAQKLTKEDYLVTFGITPSFAETGFGYIEANGENVNAFHEKPDLDTATEYLESGNYYWNSGMFCFKAGIFLEELKKYAPKIYETSQKAFDNAEQVTDNQSRIRADFIYENLQIQNNVIHQSYVHGVDKLLFLGSTCIYPKNAPQPMKEDSLLTSPLEYTNEPYAIAKIAGIKMCESYNLQYGTNFISVMPTNLYEPNDNFDLEISHVLPALLRKMHEAKLNNASKVEIWGSGKPRREFLYSENMADACVFLLENRDFKDTYSEDEKEIRNTHINIGTGKDISIKELAETIKRVIGFQGELYFNTEKPDGTMVKLTDPSKLHVNLAGDIKLSLKMGLKPCMSGI